MSQAEFYHYKTSTPENRVCVCVWGGGGSESLVLPLDLRIKQLITNCLHNWNCGRIGLSCWWPHIRSRFWKRKVFIQLSGKSACFSFSWCNGCFHFIIVFTRAFQLYKMQALFECMQFLSFLIMIKSSYMLFMSKRGKVDQSVQF